MVAFILPANSASSGDFITNSLRLNDDDTPRLARTPSTAGSRRTFSISFWQKKGNTDHDNDYIIFVSGNNDATNFEVSNHTSQAFQIGLHTVNLIRTNRLFRDPSAWTHFFFFIDTTQASESNRFQLYINGVQETSFAQTNIPDQNADIGLGRDVATTFFAQNDANSIDAYISDFHYIDGIKKAPTDFGETNSNGVWVPIEYEGNYGDQGIHLEFKATGTSANASGIGADTSGNGNHLTPTNLTALDVTTDTPMNNFCTLNPLDVYASSGGTLSEGNTKLVVTTSELHTAAGTFAPTNGKWYWEVELDATDGSNPSNVGISDLARDTKANMPSKLAWGYGYNASTGDKQNSGTNSSYGDSYGAGDIVSVAMDLDNGAVYFAKNGTFQASGDPTSGASKTNAAFTWTPDNTMNWAPYVADNTSGVSFTWLTNFGNAPFAISSGNSDADGHGNFEFAVPSGYFALCTKNLAEYG